MRPDNQCVICSFQTTAKYCSDVCERGAAALAESQQALLNLQNDPDKKIYFYDHFLSDLMDQYTIELLRVVHVKGLMKQQKHYDRVAKLMKAINKKINRGYINNTLLQNLSQLLEKLYHANAQAWQYRSNWDNTNFSGSERADFAANYLAQCCYRNQIKNEIDLLFDGEIHRELL